MIWTDVNSSHIRQIGYEPGNATLGVKFHNGHVYHYKFVDIEHFHGMLKAPSVGQYLHQVIKPRYRGQRIEK